jgi:hypothetical protein
MTDNKINATPRPAEIDMMEASNVTVRVKWRVGRKVPRNLYLQLGTEPSDSDPDVGRMDTPELAALAVLAVNEHLAQRAATVL